MSTTFAATFLVIFLHTIWCNAASSPQIASISQYPYVAFVRSSNGIGCSGIIISSTYVVTPAFCVARSKSVVVYVGTELNPHFTSTKVPANLRYQAQSINIHDEFKKVGDTFKYNIALVELKKDLVFNPSVRPANLLPGGGTATKMVKTVGWYHDLNPNLKFSLGELLTADECRKCFGKEFFEDQEICFKTQDQQTSLNLIGNPVELNGNVIGMILPGLETKDNCSTTFSVLNLSSFSEWIKNNAQVNMNAPKQTPIQPETPRTSPIDDSATIKDLKEQIKHTSGAQDTLENKINVLENKLSQAQKDTVDLLASFDKKIKELSDKYGTECSSAKNRLDAVEDATKSYLKNTESLVGRVNNAEKNIDIIQLATTNSNSLVNNLNNQVNKIENNIKGCACVNETRLQHLEDTINMWDNAANDVEPK